MTWIADAARCREMDRRAQDEFGIPLATLMESAGAAVAQAALEMLNGRHPVLVVCGKGHNGGDGLVAARLLHERDVPVRVALIAEEECLAPETARELALARQSGVPILSALEPNGDRLIIDALLGTGLRGPATGPTKETIEAMNASGVPILAVDIPSGLNADTGRAEGVAIRAARTVTFGLLKPGFFQNDGVDLVGSWSVAPIGFPESLLTEPTGMRLTSQKEALSLLPRRRRDSHKGDNGHLLLIAGSDAMPGAAVLACLAALRGGVGLVTVAAPPSVCQAVMAHAPEALLRPYSGAVRLDGKFDAVAVGPGLGKEADRILALLAEWTGPTLLDADALNAIARGANRPPGPCLFTPHPGEMGRLLGCETAEVQADRFDAALRASERFVSAVLLKGAYTVVAAPGETLAINSTGNPGMATGGMGDVLTGLGGALLAQGLDPFEAGRLAAYWHGVAGDLCAETVGEVGFTASEVARALPFARARISSC